jgi:hypothetical protein
MINAKDQFRLTREKIKNWRKRLPMFSHDINLIETVIEQHIQNYSIALVHYRQSHKKKYLEKANEELKAIANVVATAEKMELMALLIQ